MILKKPTVPVNDIDKFLEAQAASEHRPVKKSEWDAQNIMFTSMMGILQQQIIGLDVTIGLLIESNCRNFEIIKQDDGTEVMRVTPWSKIQIDQFKQEVRQRVEALALEIAEKQKTQKSLVSLK
jgi:hypothetical protein